MTAYCQPGQSAEQLEIILTKLHSGLIELIECEFSIVLGKISA
jgi:hypothetical protein